MSIRLIGLHLACGAERSRSPSITMFSLLVLRRIEKSAWSEGLATNLHEIDTAMLGKISELTHANHALDSIIRP